MKKKTDAGYNERLFSPGIRGRLHAARFEWLAKKLLRLKCEYNTVLELGCFDGKVLDYLPNKPERYLGLDANWEGGLGIAAVKWKDQDNYVFKQCMTPDEMGIQGEQYVSRFVWRP